MLSRRAVLAGASAAIVASAAPRRAWSRTEADVIVIGAGLAGLHAAGLLEAEGLRVIVIESERRVGGRLHTLDDLPGKPEAGGIQVGSGYARLIGLARRHDIALVDQPPEPRDALYRINEQTVAAKDWANARANFCVGEERAIQPAALGGHFARKLPQLESTEAWGQATALDMPYRQALATAGASEEARRLIAANLNGNGLDSLSALHIARSGAIFRAQPGPVRTIAGGSQRLPEAMARALKAEVRFGQTVTAIAARDGSATVRLSNSAGMTARDVICTVPFAALRTMPIEHRIGGPLSTLIRDLPYTRASFVYLAADRPFWREDGLPATLWSDNPMIGRVFVLGDDPPMLKVWLSGPSADLIDSTDDHGLNAIVTLIEQARPSARGRLRVVRRFSWQARPGARGIYHHIGVGQGRALARAIALPGHPLHFAGEHLARTASGMEGALESGERVARTILASR